MTARARFTQADIARALRAAAKIGRRMVVEVKPDGTLRILQEDEPPQKPTRERKEIVL